MSPILLFEIIMLEQNCFKVNLFNTNLLKYFVSLRLMWDFHPRLKSLQFRVIVSLFVANLALFVLFDDIITRTSRVAFYVSILTGDLSYTLVRCSSYI